MTHSIRRVMVAAVLVVVATAVAIADPINVVTQQRAAVANIGNDRSVDVDINVLTSTVTSQLATPSSSVTITTSSNFNDSMHWSGSGTASALWTAGRFPNGIAGINARFFVTSPVDYAFNATFFEAINPCCDALAQSIVVLFRNLDILDESGDRLEEDIFSVFDTASSTLNGAALRHISTGRLVPGEYNLGVDAAVFGSFTPGSADANFRFTLDFTAIDAATTPEPASLVLVGCGLAMVARRQRAKKAAQSDAH